MRTNKFALSLAVAGLLAASTALAETDGAFVGVQLGYGGAKAEVKTDTEIADTPDWNESISVNKSGSSFRYGIMGGYKQFFTDNFGLRYYGVLDFGTQSQHKVGADENGDFSVNRKISTWNINANVDALFNFVQNDSLDFGVFGGLSLGYASHNAKEVAVGGMDASDNPQYKDLTAGGFDFGINLGLKAQVAKNHGIELYSRFSVLKQKDDVSADLSGDGSGTYIVKSTLKVNQPYAVGLRYTFSF